MSMNDSDLRFRASIQDDVTPQIQKLEAALKKAGASQAEIKMFLRAYDEATPKIKEAQRQLNSIPKQTIINIKANSDDVHQHMEKITRAAKEPIRLTFVDNLHNIMDKVRGVGNMAALPLANALPMSIGYNLYWGLGAGILGGAGVGASTLGKAAIGDNANMEQSMVTLQQTLKDNTRSQQEMGKLIGIAQRTPFNYQDVMQADVRLRSYQIPAMPGEHGGPKGKGWLGAAGNMAAAMGTPITQSVEAIADARQGYFVRLMDYGVRLQREDFAKGGKYSGLTYEQGLERAIKRFEGAQEMQSKTFKGIMSNLHDLVQNQFTRPVGAVPFQFLKQQAGDMYKKSNTDAFQRGLGTEVEKIERGTVSFFEKLQKGKQYFDANLKQPILDITMQVIKFGSVVGKTFGGTVLTVVKTFGEAVMQLANPLGKLMGSGTGEFLTKWVTFFKALQFLGVRSADPFLGLAKSVNPLTFSLKGFLGNLLSIPGAIAKIGTLILVKQLLDARQATEALNNQFRDLSKHKLDNLNADVLLMAHGLDQAGSSMQRLVTVAAQGIPKGVHGRPDLAVDVAKYGAGAQQQFGLNATNVVQAITREMHRTNQYTPAAAEQFANEVKNAGVAAKALGYKFTDLARTMDEFKAGSSRIGMAGIGGAPTLLALQAGANAVPLTHGQLQSGIYNGDTLMQGMLQAFGHPSIDMLNKLGPKVFDKAYSFSNTNLQGLKNNFFDRNDTYAQNNRSAANVNAQVHTLAPDANIPRIANPWVENHMGIDLGKIDKINDPIQRANAVFSAWSKNQGNLDGVNAKVQKLTDSLNKQNAVSLAYSQALDNVQLQLQMFEHTLVPLQRAIEDQQLAVQKYQFNALHPLERQMTRLNEVAQEVSNTLQNAQYDMGKYTEGLLTGEQAALDQLHALEQYNKQLQLLQVIQQQLGAQLGSTTYERGYSAYVKPMMGLTLAMQMQKGEREQTRAQLQYDLTYGEKHYQLQQAARSKYQKQEMSFSQRLSGIEKDVPIIDRMTAAQHHLGNQQFELQKKMFHVNEILQDQQDNLTGLQIKLQEAAQSPHMRKLQDEQYNLQIATTKANIALQQQQTTIDRWNAVVDDLKTQGQDLGNIFNGMLGFDSKHPFDTARKMIEELRKLPASLGGISNQQADSFESQLNKMQTAVEKAQKRNISTSQNWFDQLKRGFTGMFSEDTWRIVGSQVKKGLDGVVGGTMAGLIGGGVSVGGEAASVLFGAGVVGNVVRLGAGRAINRSLTHLGLADRAFTGLRNLAGRGALASVGGQTEELGSNAVSRFFLQRFANMQKLMDGTRLGGTWGEALTGPFRLLRQSRQFLGGMVGAGLGTAIGGPLLGLAGGWAGRGFGATHTYREDIELAKRGLQEAARSAELVGQGVDKAKEGVVVIGTKAKEAWGPIEEAAQALVKAFPALGKVEDVARAIANTRLASGIRAAVAAPDTDALHAALTAGVFLKKPLRSAKDVSGALDIGGGASSLVSESSHLSGILRNFTRFSKFGAGLQVLGTALDASDVVSKRGTKQRQAAGSLVGTAVGGGIGFALLGPGGALLGAGIGSLVGMFVGKFWKELTHGIGNLVKKIPGLIGQIPRALGIAVGTAMKFMVVGLPKLIGQGIGALVKFMATGFWNLLTKWLPSIIGSAFSAIPKLLSSLPGTIWKAAQGVGGALINAIGSIFSAAWNMIKKVASAPGNFIKGVWHGLGFAGGLDYVPRDEYPARLHQGEAVLQSTDADQWRRMKRGGHMTSVSATGGATLGGKTSRGAVGGRMTIPAELTSPNADANPFLTHIRKTHKQIETMVLSHGQHINKEADKSRKQDDSNLSKHTSKQTKTVKKAADSQVKATKGGLNRQHKNADKGYNKTHDVIKGWTDKINKQIDSTRGGIHGLNGDLNGLGTGAPTFGAPGGGHHGAFGNLKDFVSFQKQQARNRGSTIKQAQGMSTSDIRNLLSSLDHLGGSRRPEFQAQIAVLQNVLDQRKLAAHPELTSDKNFIKKYRGDLSDVLPGIPDASKHSKSVQDIVKDHHAKVAKIHQDAHDKGVQLRDAGFKDHRDKLGQHHKDVEGDTTNHSTNLEKIRSAAHDQQNKIEDKGYGKIYSTTHSWLKKVVKTVKGTATDLGLTHNHDSGNSSSGDVATSVPEHDVGITSHASGGLLTADKYKVGPGRLVRVAEEGHSEMIIPLAPHRRHRAMSLIKQAHSMVGGHGIHGFASGGYVNPFSSARGLVPERVDMGVDYSMAVGSKIRAIGDADIVSSMSGGSGWPGGGWISYRLKSGAAKGKTVFVAEDVRPSVSKGSVHAGDVIATFVGGSSGIETGWASGVGTQTLAAALGQQNKGGDPGEFPTAAGANFSAFLESLGAPGGIISGKPRGKMPAKWGDFSGMSFSSLPGIPASKLKKMGLVGNYLIPKLQKLRKKWQKKLGSGGGNVNIPDGATKHKVIEMAAKAWNVPAWLLWGVFGTESAYGTNLATSSAGAEGYFQFLPSTAKSYNVKPNDLRSSALGAAHYLSDLFKQFHSWSAATNAYSGGGGSTYWNSVKSKGKSFAGGIKNVPYDGFKAVLHQGERVMTAGENNHAKSGGIDWETKIRKLMDNIDDITDKIRRSEKHLRGIKDNTDKKAAQKDLNDLNAQLHKKWGQLASSTAKGDKALAKRIAATGDPSDGERTAALIASEKQKFNQFVAREIAKVKRSPKYKKAVKRARVAARRVKSAIKKAKSKHSPGGRKITKGERRHINQLKKRAKKLAAIPKRMLAQARKRGRANYVVDAAHRGINAGLMRQITGKGLTKGQSKLYNKLVKALQTGDKHAGAYAKQLRASIMKEGDKNRKHSSKHHSSSLKAAAKRASTHLKHSDSHAKTSVKHSAEAKKQRDAAVKESRKITNTSHKSDDKRSKAEDAADKREKDFYKKALHHLEKISGKDMNVNVHNTATGATLKTTLKGGRYATK